MTDAELTLAFRSDTPGAANGARVEIDGAALTDSLVAPSLVVALPAGEHRLVIHKDCVGVSPAETSAVVVVAGRHERLEYGLSQLSGLSVTSTPAGLPVWLDGRQTGQVTPAALACVAPGAHEVRLSVSGPDQVGFDVVGDTLRQVELGSAVETVDFTLAFTPRAQARGVLLEMFTSTWCPNCAPADHAVDLLDRDPDFDRGLLSVTMIHLWWTGLDPLFNEELGQRADFYRIVPSTSPHALFNGGDKVTGTFYDDLTATYKSKIQNTYGLPARVALYWLNPRVEGNLLRGRLRYVALDDLTDLAGPELNAFFGKDSLRITDPAQNPNNLEWVQGARDFIPPISLIEAGALSPGSVLDVEVSFDLGADHLADYLDWSSGALRLTAFVQDTSTRDVLQCREVSLKKRD